MIFQSFKLKCVLAMSMLVSACTGNVLEFRNAEIVHGKIYEQDANEPFTGKVTNVPDKLVLSTQRGFEQFGAFTVQFVLPAQQRQIIANMVGLSGNALLGDSHCEVQVNKGVLNGDAVCFGKNNNSKIFEMSFVDGQLDGEFLYYGPKGGDHVVAELSMKKGLPDGKHLIHSQPKGNIIFEMVWENGKGQGKQKIYNEVTGELTSVLTYVDGKVEGDMVRYAPDGKQIIYKATAVGGLKHGVEEHYTIEGKPLFHGQWLHGKQNGVFKQWDGNGNLISEVTWSNGVQQQQNTPENTKNSLQNIDACVENWIKAYRAEVGEDAVVKADQMTEWEDWCNEGKQPE